MATKARPKALLINHVDAAVMVGVSTKQLLRWAKTGAGGFPRPCRVIDRTYLFSHQEVERWARLRPAAPEGGRENDGHTNLDMVK
jgi:predicted DNA-binding transcriptional regulator AlpA